MDSTLRRDPPRIGEDAENLLLSLSSKQREVLDLLLAHHTTKQMSKVLGLSPHTIDSRILDARAKLDASDRKDLIRRYSALLDAVRDYAEPIPAGVADLPSDQRKTMHGFPLVDFTHNLDEPEFTGLPRTPHFELEESASFVDFQRWSEAPSGPEALDARFGKSWRLVAIPVLAILIGMVLIWAVAFARTLGDVL